MHDTFLLNKISKSLKKVCEENNIQKITQLTITVNYNSHVNEKNLREHLEQNNNDMLSKDFIITVQREEIEDQTAIIQSIQGEGIE